MDFFNGPSTSKNGGAPNPGNENNDNSRKEFGLNGNLSKKTLRKERRKNKNKNVIVQMNSTEYVSNIPGDAKMDTKISIASNHPDDPTVTDSETSPIWNANMKNVVGQEEDTEKKLPTNSNIENKIEVVNEAINNEVVEDIDNATLELWVSYLHAKYPHLYNLPLE